MIRQENAARGPPDAAQRPAVGHSPGDSCTELRPLAKITSLAVS